MNRFLVLGLLIFLSACNAHTSGGGLHLLGTYCEGVLLPEDREEIYYHSRPDRTGDGFLRVKGSMALSSEETSCAVKGRKVKVNAALALEFQLGRLGRINQNDKATYILPYVVLVVDNNTGQVLGQDIVSAKAEFLPHERMSSRLDVITQDIPFRYSRDQKPEAVSVMIGFLHPETRKRSKKKIGGVGRHWRNKHAHPTLYMLKKKPAYVSRPVEKSGFKGLKY